jgi:hypothetical protein
MDNITQAEREIVRLAHERSTALVQKDTATLDRLLATTFCYTNANGITLTKTDYFQQYVETSHIIWTAQTLDETQVSLYNHTAVLTCRIHDQGLFGDQPFDAYYRSTFVWIYQQGSWQCVAGHTTAITQPEEVE